MRTNTTNTLLDELKEAHGLPSDYALKRLLGMESSGLSNYRNFRSQFSDEMALRAAKLLDRPPAPILAMLAAERAKDPEVAKVWAEAAKTLAQTRRGRSGR